MNTNPFAKAIYTRRYALNMTQTTLAKRSGLSQSTIAQVELGQKLPSLNTTLKIFKVLKLKLVIQ